MKYIMSAISSITLAVTASRYANQGDTKRAYEIMLRKFYFSPSFWLINLPLLLLPSPFARFFEPLRWKYLEVRAFFGNVLRKII